jgi:hypothetical protein
MIKEEQYIPTEEDLEKSTDFGMKILSIFNSNRKEDKTLSIYLLEKYITTYLSYLKT